MHTCKCGQKNNVSGRAAGTKLLCAGCDAPFTVPTPKGKSAYAEIDTWDKAKVAKACRPVLIYYFCAGITDASNPNWAFSRKLEMQCFTRKENNELLKKRFYLEKVGVKYDLKTRRG